MAPKRTAPVGQVVAYGIIRAVAILKRVTYGRKTFCYLTGEVCAWPSGGAVSQGESAGKRPCPLPPALWLRNPQSAIRNPQSVSGIRNPYQKSVLYFFSPGRLQGIFMAGLIRNNP
jgi:hypothetical protein